MNKKLNILFLNSWYPSKVLPTNGDFIQRHAEAVSIKHNVYALHVITNKNQTKNLEIEKSKINNVNTLICYVRFSKNPIIKIILFFKGFLNLFNQLPRIDIVHLNVLYPAGIFALYLKWFKKIPYIISEHWTGYHYPKTNAIGTIEKIVSKYICKKAAFICPVSNDLKKSMQLFGLEGNYLSVPNVVDTSIFKVNEKASEVFNIIHVSNMKDEHKNVSGILNVIQKFQALEHKFKFFLIGENSNQYLPKIKLLKIKESNVEILDQLPQKKVSEYLQKSDVFILFSNYENLPCVILESFACGVPVIATNVGGIHEYFPDNFGKLIELGDENSILESLLEIKNNSKIDKNEMHTYVQNNFSKPVIAAIFSSLYFKSLKF